MSSTIRLQRLRWYVTDLGGHFVASNFAGYSEALKWCKYACMKLKHSGALYLVWTPEHKVCGVVSSPSVQLRGIVKLLNRWNGATSYTLQQWKSKRATIEMCDGKQQQHDWEASPMLSRCKVCGIIGGSMYQGRVQVKTCYHQLNSGGKRTRCGRKAYYIYQRRGGPVASCLEHKDGPPSRKRRNRRKWRKKDVDAARVMVKNGESYRAIGRALGLNHSTVKAMLERVT